MDPVELFESRNSPVHSLVYFKGLIEQDPWILLGDEPEPLGMSGITANPWKCQAEQHFMPLVYCQVCSVAKPVVYVEFQIPR